MTPTNEDMELLGLAAMAARRAGEALLARFRRAPEGLTTKSSPTDVVSDADREADTLIQQTIRAARPADDFLTEESGALGGGAPVRWIVDPLDGTVNYLYGIGHFAVSIAAERRGEVVAGVVFNPVTGELFEAVRGGGARVNGGVLACTRVASLDRALVATGFYYTPETRAAQVDVVRVLVPRVRDLRRAGAASLDLAAVAAGRLDAYYEAPLGGLWDSAAGQLLVEESGGVVRELVAPWASTPGVIAAGAELMPIFEAEIRALLRGPDAAAV